MPYYNEKIEKDAEKFITVIESKVYQKIAELETTAWITAEPVPYENRMQGKETRLSLGTRWGELWDCAWFHFTGCVPDKAKGKKIVLRIDVSGEACVFDDSGNPVQGLTNVMPYGLARATKRVVPFLDQAEGGEKVDLWADGGCNDLFGRYRENGILQEASIAVCDERIRKLYYDYVVLYELMKVIPATKARHFSIMNALNKAANVLYAFNEEEVELAIHILKKELDKKGGDPSLTVSAVGHAHIDLAWLWPIRETIRKGARTFSSVLAFMERYPDYVFGSSQPQLYAWMKQYYPGLYKRIQSRVKEGRWEVQGGMWVESDCNVSGGEALIRQILYGKRFFRQEFGKDVEVLWLPDVFGFTGALPQIMLKSGLRYFMTMKISWNMFNKLPHHTFYWQGIDGSRVLTHMLPEGNYNSGACPVEVNKIESNFQERGLSSHALMLFGIGDGGGGPGTPHLEKLERMKNLDGIPPVIQEPAINFFRKIEEENLELKSWVGELYLERHQGTLTTQARNKWFNRRMETALRELEFAGVLASHFAGSAYPSEELDTIWKEVLLYQFHDILPGSSIKRVYDESLERYSAMYEKVHALMKDAYQAFAAVLGSSGMASPYAVFNSTSWDRSEWIKLDNKWVKTNVPAMGWSVVDANSGSAMEGRSCLHADIHGIENEILAIQFGDDGSIRSVFDKQYMREVLDTGSPANILKVYEDKGDAWDFDINYRERKPEKFILKDRQPFLDGPRAGVRMVYTYHQSELTQEVVLTEGERRIDFITKIQWNERFKMLRTNFAVNIHADCATCNIQFGTIKRPTHQNTSWDMARFEVCAHKWVDLSQGDYGIALLNDSKYGHMISGNLLDLNLLRSPNHPGEEADKGEHQFTYSLLPHNGNEAEANVEKDAAALNIPLQTISVTRDQAEKVSIPQSFISKDAKNIVIETVKAAQEGDGIIIRLYEVYGKGTKAHIQPKFDFQKVFLVDMMEENPAELTIDGKMIELQFKPYEIHTIKLL